MALLRVSLTLERRLLVVLLLAGAALRVSSNDARYWSPADETTYLRNTRALAKDGFLAGYPELLRAWAQDSSRWETPDPLRFGTLWLATVACRLSLRCDYRTLAWLSTLAGIAALVFTFLLGSQFLGERAALIGVALTLFSPLQIASSRRALQDELACATALAAIWAMERALRAGRHHLLAAALIAVALSVKLSFVLFAPSLALLWLLAIRRRGFLRRDLWLLAGPAAYFLCYCLLSRSPSLFFTIVDAQRRGMDYPYSIQYQSGPLHRYLFDALALSPLIFLCATLGAGLALGGKTEDDQAARKLSLFTLVVFGAFALTTKNARLLIAGDALLRLLAGWALLRLFSTRRIILYVAVAVLASVDLWHYQRVFVERHVYDPTTYEILKALDSIPR